MLSSVFLTGRIGEVLTDKIRYVEVDRVIPGPSGHYATDKFLVKTMLSREGLFMKAKVGSFISLKGRLEVDEEYGLVIVDELDEIYGVNLKVKEAQS